MTKKKGRTSGIEPEHTELQQAVYEGEETSLHTGSEEKFVTLNYWSCPL